MADYTCDATGCESNRESGMLYCQQHLGEEINRHLAQTEEWEMNTCSVCGLLDRLS